MRYVIFGAGNFGTQAIDLIGKSNIEFYFGIQLYHQLQM